MDKPFILSNIEASFRKKRFAIVRELVYRLSLPIRILDVGGTMNYWRGVGYDDLPLFECTLFNIVEQVDLDDGFYFTFGDACDLSRYRDRQFDLVFSNSVINLVGEGQKQRQMAMEIRRVGKSYCVQTPNRFFPVDWRTYVPFFHFLPKEAQSWLLRHTRVGLYNRTRGYDASTKRATRVRDLAKAEVRKLFPEGTIKSERVLGFTKSFVVYGSC